MNQLHLVISNQTKWGFFSCLVENVQLGCSSEAASAQQMKCDTWLKPTKTFITFGCVYRKLSLAKFQQSSDWLPEIVSSQQTFLRENLPIKKHLRMRNSQIASPVILFPFFIFARILYNLQAFCMRWETICPRARVHEILGCFLSFSWENWSLKSNSWRKLFACRSSSLARLDLIQSTFNTFFLLYSEQRNGEYHSQDCSEGSLMTDSGTGHMPLRIPVFLLQTAG